MITPLFPTLIREETLSLDLVPMVNRCYEIRESFTDYKPVWRCNTFTSLHSTYNLKTDAVFSDLVKQAESLVSDFSSKYFNSNKKYYCDNAWFNICYPGDYQEYHMHPDSHFSLAYYLRAPKGCGNFVVVPLTYFTDNYPVSSEYHSIEPKENNIVIFRSNVNHMVEINKSNEERISVSMNFRCLE